MINKWVTLEDVKKCSAHESVVIVASHELRTRGFLLKDDVLAKAEVKAVGDSIRWDLISQLLNEYSPKPLTQSFLNAYGGQSIESGLDVTEHVGTTHGARCVGYAATISSNRKCVLVIQDE